jgi:hypothetical protein
MITRDDVEAAQHRAARRRTPVTVVEAGDLPSPW